MLTENFRFLRLAVSHPSNCWVFDVRAKWHFWGCICSPYVYAACGDFITFYFTTISLLLWFRPTSRWIFTFHSCV